MNSKKNIESIRKTLGKQKYAFAGHHSAVQICRWTKNSLNKKGSCWKEKFYGIESHRCCEMSPAVIWCENQCLHCWRPIELNLGTKLETIDEPEKILTGIIEARKKLIMGFKGNKKVSEKKFKEALEPTLFTMSLSGEPTLYPRLGELFSEIRKRKCISFLVTNGQNPEVLEKLEKENNLPTQLTISMNAGNEKLFKLWHRSSKKDAWKRFNQSLDIIKNLKEKTRRAVRLTLVKPGTNKAKYQELTNMSDENAKEYALLIKKADPDFIHVKGFMSVGYSRERLGYDKMPWHYEIKKFAEKLLEELKKQGMKDYKIMGEEKRSCVVLLAKNKKDLKIKNV